jgi:hypothetical protein
MPERKLTVSKQYPKQRNYKNSRVSEPHAYIRISGKWMKEYGFRPGDKVTVEASNNQLIISK